MALSERLKSNERNPYINVLSSFNLLRPYDRNVYFNPIIISRYQGPKVTSAKSNISIQNEALFQDGRSQEYTAKDKDVKPRKSEP